MQEKVGQVHQPKLFTTCLRHPEVVATFIPSLASRQNLNICRRLFFDVGQVVARVCTSIEPDVIFYTEGALSIIVLVMNECRSRRRTQR